MSDDKDLRDLILKLNSSRALTPNDRTKITKMHNVTAVRVVCPPVMTVDVPPNLTQFMQRGNVSSLVTGGPFMVSENVDLGLDVAGFTRMGSKNPVLGQGEFGKVEVIFHKHDARLAAVKIITIDDFSYRHAFTEVTVMKSIKHENVVDFIFAFASKDKEKTTEVKSVHQFCILMEYTNAGTMATEIRRYQNKYISEAGARYYIKQIIAGLIALHEVGITHTDLHVHNVLLKYMSDARHKTCKISDFGSAHLPNQAGIDKAGVKKDSLSVYIILMTMLCGISTDGLTFKDPSSCSHMSHHLVSVLHPIKEEEDFAQVLRSVWFWLPDHAPDPGDGFKVPALPALPPPKFGTSVKRASSSQGRSQTQGKDDSSSDQPKSEDGKDKKLKRSPHS